MKIENFPIRDLDDALKSLRNDLVRSQMSADDRFLFDFRLEIQKALFYLSELDKCIEAKIEVLDKLPPQ